ncbi:MMPL family transporter [Gordonia sp. VNK21]|uniref:MMPL family transporter n=1 Tax=Gordonia sp. VNK21 TaxID=3382483 RepID=UPI0038D46B48
MFGHIGTFVYRMRYTVIAVLVVLMGGLGLYGLGLGNHLSQSGWFDEGSESVKGSLIADEALGRDHKSDVLLLITPPSGTRIDDPAFGARVEQVLDDLVTKYPDIVSRENPSGPDDTEHAGFLDPFPDGSGAADQAAQQIKRDRMWNLEENTGFVSIGVRGNDDTTILANFQTIEPFFENLPEKYSMPGATFELAGLQPVASAMSHGMDEDIKRAELIGLPIVGLMLLFVFGGVVAAALPVLIGGLTIAGSLGIMTILAQLTELNVFAQSVVTLIGLGIAIDYGLFIVSRFREELAEGYTVPAAVRRTVMTSGQTVVFSATIIVAALACLLIFPQAFLKSVAYGAIASVALAAILSITVLPAILSILGRRVDALSVPFLNRTKTREEIENGFWGRLAGWVMQHPIKTAVPTVLLLLALIIPFGNIAFGGMSEKYLPPDNPTRVAQEHFDERFPAERTEEIKLVVVYPVDDDEAGDKIEAIAAEANKIPGFTKQFSTDAAQGALDGEYREAYGVTQMSAGLTDRDTAGEAIKELRDIDDQGLTVFVAGTPALTQDSMDSLMSRLPLMAVLLVLVTGLLMFLAFGSIILPIKAALVSVLGLGATLGILTWMFLDGHGASLLNYTPGPLFSAVLVLIIAIIYGLSTDYEIFLLSRMVEARQQGASTTEAVRLGTAHTGRIITAAAAILVVVSAAFGLSDIVMMKYIAFGMIAALILDATIIRMLLVPAVMKLLGDDCWWAPRWMLKLQRKIGLGETILEDEPQFKEVPVLATGSVSAGGVVAVAEAETTALRAQQARPKAGMAEPRRTGRFGRRDDDADAPDSGPQPTAEATLTDLVDDADEPAEPQRAEPQRIPQRGPARAPQQSRGAQPARPAADPAPAAPARPAPSQRSAAGPQSESPDTGSWRLGAGGVRLGGRDLRPRPQAPSAPPLPQTPAAPARRPAAEPEQPRRTPPAQRNPQVQPDRQDSPGRQGPQAQPSRPGPRRSAQPATPVPPLTGASALDPNVDIDQVRSSRSEETPSRELRRDRDGQISVQDLLRRSRSQHPEDD